MNVFLDTNVVIDLLAERKPFYFDAATIVEMHRQGFIHIVVSSLTIVNCAYILRKAYSESVMLKKVEVLCDMFNVLPVDRSAIMKAVESKRHDFEDAVQYYSSLSGKPDVIVSRDVHGFSNLPILVMTPSDFIAKARVNNE